MAVEIDKQETDATQLSDSRRCGALCPRCKTGRCINDAGHTDSEGHLCGNSACYAQWPGIGNPQK